MISLIWMMLVISNIGFAMRMSPEGEYTHITVKIQDDISDQDCNIVLTNLKTVLVEASKVVGNALSWRAWPASWIIVVPSHWSQEQCSQFSWEQAQGSNRYTKTDVSIQSKSELVVEDPFTLQSQSCGSPGDYIAMPVSFLKKSVKNITKLETQARAQQFAHEFIKLRFGVFDERGFPGDHLYPSSYKTEKGTYQPTGRSNKEINGVWKSPVNNNTCRPDLEQCIFEPTGQNSDVTCSLGHFSNLPNANMYCSNKQKTNKFTGPSKQAILCSGQSILEVINSSQDWDQLSSTSTVTVNSENKIAQVNFVKVRATRYILVLEISADMADRDDWKFIKKALQKLIRHDLPDSAELSIVTFSNSSKVEATMTKLNGNRGFLVDSVPDRYRLAEDIGQCVQCGVTTAITDVLKDDKDDVHIILVTRGGPDSINLNEERVLKQAVDYYQIKISSILVPKTPGTPLTFFDDLAQISGGQVAMVMGKGPIERFREVSKALGSIVTAVANQEVVIEEQIVDVSGAELTTTKGGFFLDSFLGKDTQFGIYVEDEEQHLVKSVTLVDSKGTTYGPYTRVSTEYDSFNLKTLRFVIADHLQPLSSITQQGQRWTYTVEWHKPHRVASRQAAVVVTSKKRGGEGDFVIEMWTNSKESVDIATANHLLGVYVKVMKDGMPVIGATVTVHGQVIISNSTLINLNPIVLTDNGDGQPDIMAADGVYSKYLLEYPGIGRYSFSVVVEGKGKAVVPRDINERSRAVCCGSNSGLGVGKVELLGDWKREKIQGASINLLEIPDMKKDQKPPSRIIDLEARVIDGTHQVVFGWTSPGGDFAEGMVEGYQLLYSSDLFSLLEGKGSIMTEWERQEMGGLRTTFEMLFNILDQVVYVALVGKDNAGNYGSLSNIVEVKVANAVSSGANTILGPSGVEMEANQDNPEEWMMILALCGAFLLLAICLLAGVFYFLRCSRPRKFVTTEETTDTSSSCSDPKNCSSNRLMPELMSQLSSRDLETFTAPPTSLPDSTPSYWSASQLLSEHEQRALSTSFAPVQGPLSPIREEYDSLTHEGVANPAFKTGYATPETGISMLGSSMVTAAGSRVSAASDKSDKSILSGVSLLYRDGDIPETPVRFSTAVQTVAPSTIATLRQNTSYMTSLKHRSVSLV